MSTNINNCNYGASKTVIHFNNAQFSSTTPSGVARYPATWGNKYSCAPCLQNTQSLKWKSVNKCGRSKNRTVTVVILFFFEGNKTHFSARNKLGKAVIVGRSYNAGVSPEANGGSGTEPPTLRRYFTVFSKKNTHF